MRGSCGTRHRTEEAAAEHCRQDNRDVKRGHGSGSYSDRHPVEHDTPPRPGAEIEARLEAAQAKVEDADAYAATARAERDALVAAAVDSGMTKYRVAQVIGVSQHAVTLMLGDRRSA